ncbi:MAG: acyltransferase family protein [Rubrivivax sp.]|nr:acyltransferase family protein [Rubrivivax sp.]
MTTSSHLPTAAVPATVPAPVAAREHFIDWLRIVALGLLVLYHVGMAYTGWGWHVKSEYAPQVAALVEPWMRLTAPWRMTLLFVVSGLATALMLRRHEAGAAHAEADGAARGWLGRRARRLLLPLAAGMLLVVPPQAWFEVRQYHAYGGSFTDFMKLYVSAYGGFCSPERGCLILPTWNHLWFLPYLFAYTALLAWLHRRWPRALDTAARRLADASSASASALVPPILLLGLPVAWFMLTRLTLGRVFGETHAFFDDVFLHAQFAPAFFAGVLLGRVRGQPAVGPWARLEALRHLALALTLLAWALLVATTPGAPWRALPWSVMQACGVVAALGYARVHLQRDGAVRRYLGGAVFPVYVFHQTITVAGVAWLAQAPLAPAFGAPAEAALLVVLTLAGSFAGYELVRRVRWLAPWFGVGDTRRVVAVPAQGDEMRVTAPRVST